MIKRCNNCSNISPNATLNRFVSINGSSAKFQDSMYGKGIRVMNFMPAKNKNNIQYRCTICSSVQD